MYQLVSADGLVCFNINYAECCKHRWIVERYDLVDGKWIRSRWYRRLDSLEECKAAAKAVMKRDKIPTTFAL